MLSLFPGLDLLGMGFESEGFCVVRGPDTFLGGDIRRFFPPAGHFNGIIGGSPCQDFSKARRTKPKPYACDVTGRREYTFGVAMLREFTRCVTSTGVEWFLHENVPAVPSLEIPGYTIQRFNINVTELGHNQNRHRCIQFGSRDGCPLVIPRGVTPAESQACVMASEGRRGKSRSFATACELQGLPRDFALPGMTQEGKFRLVGNGVHVGLARALARAVRDRHVTKWTLYCVCGCGAPVRRGVTLASQACRKRMSRRQQALDASLPRNVTSDLFSTAPDEG